MLNVSATSEMFGQPDTMKFHIQLENINVSYEEAMQASSIELNELKHCLSSIQIEADQLKTVDFSVNTKYENVKNSSGLYEQKFIGYIVNHRLQLTLPLDLNTLNVILNTVMTCQATPKLSIEFLIADEESLYLLAIEDASKKAMARAKTLAKTQNITLRDVLCVELIDEMPRPLYKMYEVAEFSSQSANFNLTPNDVSVSATVKVSYDIQSV